MSRERIRNELNAIYGNKIKCVFLQVAEAIDAEGLQNVSLSEDERRALEVYAYGQLTEQNLIHRLDLFEIFGRRHGFGYELVAIGFEETKAAWEVLFEHGYDPFEFFSCTPEDSDVLPNCRYAQLVNRPTTRPTDPSCPVDFEKLIDSWSNREVEHEEGFSCIRRHQNLGKLQKTFEWGLIHDFSIGWHARAEATGARPMLLLASLVVHDLVSAVTKCIPDEIPEASLDKTRVTKRRGRPPVTRLTDLESKVDALHKQGVPWKEINNQLANELKDDGEESAELIIPRIAKRKKRAGDRELRKSQDTNET